MALIFASLSSRQKLMRQVGYTAMARLYHQLESAKLTAEKKVWLHLVDIVRNGVRASKSPNMTTLKVPAVVTAFLAKICLVLRSPLDPMYKSMSSFVLAKPTMDLFKVPEFSRLFHSSELNHEEERHWLLLVLRDGLREELDYSVAQKDFFSKLLLCYHDCSMADEGSKSLIRQTMARVAEIKEPAYDLVRHHGLLTWIATQCMKYLRDAKATAELGKIATNAWKSMSGGGDENSKMPTTVLDEFSLTLDTLAAASAMVGEKTTLKSVVDALKMISLKKSLVSERQIMVYSQILG
jgi:nucleolar pre-ribosomal-associated protein 1